MYIINRGLVGSRGRVLRKGDVLGGDIICQCIRRNYGGVTLTHVHTMTLNSKKLHAVLDQKQFWALRETCHKMSLWTALKTLFVDIGRRIKRCVGFLVPWTTHSLQ